MAGSIIPATPAATVLEEQRLGYNETSLSNWNSTAEPQITGNFEIAGSLGSFATADSISGWSTLSNGTVYVKVVPDFPSTGDVSAQFTDTAPTWDDSKMGWYGTGANANHRYLFRLTKGGASLYEDKRQLNNTGDAIEAYYRTNQDTRTTDTVVFDVAQTDVETDRVEYQTTRFLSQQLRENFGEIYDRLSPLMPTTNNYSHLSGCMLDVSASQSIVLFGALRTSSTAITLFGYNVDSQNFVTLVLSDGSTAGDHVFSATVGSYSVS